MTELIPLADAIDALRAELVKARGHGEGKALQFQVGPVEVEFQAVYETEISGEGKVGFRIFGIGSDMTAGGARTDARTQRVKIILTPTDQGREWLVGDEDERSGNKAEERR